jgi:opacity protein-like surface antigen
MSRLLAALAAAALALFSTAAQAAPVAGDWIGVIQATPTVGLHVAAHFKSAPGGGWSGTLDSLDQGAMGLPLADISQAGDTLSFAVPVVHGGYSGHWKEATHAWEGTWSQGGRDMALTLTVGHPAPTAKVEGLDAPGTGR